MQTEFTTVIEKISPWGLEEISCGFYTKETWMSRSLKISGKEMPHIFPVT